MSFHSPVLRAGSKLSSPSTTFICNQCRNATLLRRPKRPYTFTQLIALSDGSTFTHRTTSPQAVYRSTRDTRNAILWNPSSVKLRNVEEDEAGRLAAFRNKYGRGWDSTTKVSAGDAEAADAAAVAAAAAGNEPVAETAKAPEEVVESEFEDEEEDNLLDLISSFGQDEPTAGSKKK